MFLPDPLTTICGSAMFFTIFPNLDYIQYDYPDGVSAGRIKDNQKVKNPKTNLSRGESRCSCTCSRGYRRPDRLNGSLWRSGTNCRRVSPGTCLLQDRWDLSQTRRNNHGTSPAPTPTHCRACHKVPRRWAQNWPPGPFFSGIAPLNSLALDSSPCNSLGLSIGMYRMQKAMSFLPWQHTPTPPLLAAGICPCLLSDSASG